MKVLCQIYCGQILIALSKWILHCNGKMCRPRRTAFLRRTALPRRIDLPSRMFGVWSAVPSLSCCSSSQFFLGGSGLVRTGTEMSQGMMNNEYRWKLKCQVMKKEFVIIYWKYVYIKSTFNVINIVLFCLIKTEPSGKVA